MSETILQWVEQKVFIGIDSNGHSIVIGRTGDPENPWRGVKPSDLLLMGVAACASYDVVEILTKRKEPMIDLRVITSSEQMSDPPYSFTKIHNHYIVVGAVNPQKLEKAIDLAEKKYCSVIASLSPIVDVSSDFEILEA